MFALRGGHITAEPEQTDPKSDFNPAQASSPGAHPVGNTDKEKSQATNNQNENSERSRTEGASTDNRLRNSGRGERNDRESNLDRQLATCLLTKNKGEVELGELALERAKDRDVKEFAQQMAKDHRQMVDKLEHVVGSQQPNDRRSQISREIEEVCLDSLKKELTDKSDKEFDACYIGSQISGHVQMAATLRVLAKHTSGELSEIVNEARPTVDKHLAHAKKLMDQLDKARDRAQASRNRDDRTR